MAAFESDLVQAPERPALLVGWLSPHEVVPVAVSSTTPLIDLVGDPRDAGELALRAPGEQRHPG